MPKRNLYSSPVYKLFVDPIHERNCFSSYEVVKIFEYESKIILSCNDKFFKQYTNKYFFYHYNCNIYFIINYKITKFIK